MVSYNSGAASRSVGQMSVNSTQHVTACAMQIQALSGCKEITVLKINSKTGEARRIYSSVPAVFPLLGTKQIPTGQWTTLVVKQRTSAVFIGAEQIQSTFADHEQILGHEIRAVLNVPIISEEQCVGSINCLFQEDSPTHNYEQLSKSVSSCVAASDLVHGLKSSNWEAKHE